MDRNEIKKILYKEKPLAELDGDRVYYYGELGRGDYSVYKCKSSTGMHKFVVPHDEMGHTLFEEELPAQLLIRWLV